MPIASTTSSTTDKSREVVYPAVRDPNRCPTHPGEIFREIVFPALGRNKSEIAKLLGISRQHLHDIMTERKPITAEMAVRFGKLCGNGPQLWHNMQGAHDLWKAERSVDVSNIPTLDDSDAPETTPARRERLEQ